jgi:uncharacterized protein
MIIDIERLPKEGLKVCKDYDFLSSELVEESAVFLEPAHVDLTVRRVGEEISIKGRITTRISFNCSRCLNPFEFPIDSHFDLVYLPEELFEMKDELESEDMDRFFYFNQKIDLKEIVLEQLNLTFPVKPLCSEDCQGICPVCGKIIRNGQCSCVSTRSDPRLEKLKTFIRDKR